tara:strand:+ start:2890 stop:3480 length:591 start_codon:yes stop_codon:yes gene_type:complete
MHINWIKEIGRKTIHIAILLVIIIYNIIEKSKGAQVASISLIALLGFFLILEYLRIELNWKIKIYHLFIRPKEQHRMVGSVYFLLATIISLAVFDKRIAVAALLMATFGDSAAAIIGKKYGSSLIFRNKTWAGTLAEFGINLLVGFLILSRTFNIYVILGMALAATIVEILVDELDDNLLAPIIAGFVGQVIKFAF